MRFGLAALNDVSALPVIDVKFEPLPAAVDVGAGAVDEIHRVGGEIVHAIARALVGVGDGATALQAPLAGAADRAVDAARAGGRAGDDAGTVAVPAVRDLDHQRHVLRAGAVVGRGRRTRRRRSCPRPACPGRWRPGWGRRGCRSRPSDSRRRSRGSCSRSRCGGARWRWGQRGSRTPARSSRRGRSCRGRRSGGHRTCRRTRTAVLRRGTRVGRCRGSRLSSLLLQPASTTAAQAIATTVRPW